ncbi:helix-turn-helix transcriptional regulator [Loktanella salsilacus]|uniref:helix-turn-helix transcriptional regulator n=1 Tax=Loktanella salsilacus TaxID=195913 RepID=UPI003736728C
MPDTYLADKTLAERYGVSRNTVWRWHRERPDFPRAVRLSQNCTRWRLSDIAAWEASKAEVAA